MSGSSQFTPNNTFGSQIGPISLSTLDTNFNQVATFLNNPNNYSNYLADSGAANAYVVTFPTGIVPTYTAGLTIFVKIANANTGASTINVSGLGAKSITNPDLSALPANALLANDIVILTYDGTQFILVGGSGTGKFASITNTSLTSGRVVYSTTGGLQTDSANLTFSGTLLSSAGYTATGSITGSSNVGVYAYGTLGYTDVNHILTMAASQNSYIQMEIQNTNTGSAASSDVIVSNNNTTATTYYGDFGMNSSGWTGTAGTNSFGAPNMVYLTATTGDLLLGTTTSNSIRLAVNAGADAMKVDGATSIVSFPTTGAITLPTGTTGQQPASPASGMLRFNTTTTQFEGYNGTTWSSVGGAAISNDTATSSFEYPLFSSATSGTALTVYTSNAKLLYKPSTGEFQASELTANNGLILNSATVSTSYTVASGYNAHSVGPVTVASGQSVTVSSGQRWVVL